MTRASSARPTLPWLGWWAERSELLGFNVDHDVRPTDTIRVVQLTPPGSGCSIVLSAGLPAATMDPGSLRGLHLVVDDIDAARAELQERDVTVGEIEDHGGGVRFAGFADPEGNTWALQEVVRPAGG